MSSIRSRSTSRDTSPNRTNTSPKRIQSRDIKDPDSKIPFGISGIYTHQ
jgi:hypothetical protein